MRTRESEGERQGGAWRLRASRRKQEVAEQGGGGARGSVVVSVLLAGRKTTGEGGGGGLGRLGRLVAPGRLRVSGPGRFSALFYFFSSVLFYLILFCHCFEFKNNSNNAKNSSEYFILLDGLFQKLIKYFRGI